ncbi:Snurportin-1 [Halotydeus destructor]|nr:Snurportin-1 [Halotydeus destructor]
MAVRNEEPQIFENLVDDFTFTFAVSSDVNRTEVQHPRFALYKNKSRTVEDNQEERRQKRLKDQKEKRFDLLQQLRGSNGDFDDNDSHGSSDAGSNSQDVSMQLSDTSDTPTTKSRRYKNYLMMSEWLVDVPQDFEANWLLVPCPVGKRCLVVASHGETKIFGRNGYCLKSHFPSLIPGGNKRDVMKHKESCILDCIYSERRKTLYILDLLSWNGMSFKESETHFRFYWLHSKLKEMKGISSESILNPIKFKLLPHHRCDSQSIVDCTLNLPFPEELDGLIFFHKDAHYVSEVTPLVCWLKLDMLPSILGINIDETCFNNNQKHENDTSDSMEADMTAA